MRNTSALAGFLILLYLLGIGAAVVTIIAICKIFKKAGTHPGMFFIPVYGGYLFYKIADSSALFFAQVAASVIYSIVSTIVAGSAINNYSYYSYSSYSLTRTASSIAVVAIIFIIVVFIINIFFCINLARVFGKSGGFAAGLIFLFPIFVCILGFGSAEYVGSAGYYSKGITATGTWKCPSCGAENPVYKGVCDCGTKK